MPFDLSSLYKPDEEEDFSNPVGFAKSIGLLDSYPDNPVEQRNYLDDNFGSVTKSLPIDQPSGSIVSGGREDLYHKYSQMLEQKPESERVLEDYMGRRPTREQFGNSLGRKILAGVVGLGTAAKQGGAAAYKTVSGILDEPYNEAVQDYNSEGRYINDYAKLADSSRNRQMSSLLAQMRMEEVHRANQERERQTAALRDIQRQNSELGQKRLDQSEADRAKRNDLEERRFGETQRHNKATESRLMESLNFRESKGNREKQLSPSQQLAQIKLNEAKLKMSDPAYMQMYRKIGEDPDAFFEDKDYGPDKLEGQELQDANELADQRRRLAIFNTILQEMQGGQ